jgi:hypothetical protein
MKFDTWGSFSKICRDNSILIKIWQNNWYVFEDPFTSMIIYLAEFVLEWESFQTNVVEKIKTHILCSITFFFKKSYRLWDNVEKYGRARQATDDNIIRRTRFACRITEARMKRHT